MAINVDIVALIELLATTDPRDYNFIYGSRPFLNYEATLKNLKDGKITVLMLPEVEREAFLRESPTPSYIEFSLFIQFARKWETEIIEPETGKIIKTKSKLDELYKKKYDLRLKDLKTIAKSFMTDLACQNNFRMISRNYQAEINIYASNIDAINCECVLRTV